MAGSFSFCLPQKAKCRVKYDPPPPGMMVIHQRCEVRFNNICSVSCALQTREQEELEELLLLEQQGTEQRRLEALQEEQRQLQAKRRNKQALLDELVRNTQVTCMFMSHSDVSCFMPHAHIHTHTHAHSLRVHGCDIIKSLLPVIVVQPALFSLCDSKASWLHCFELWALEVIVPAEWAAEGPSLIAR